MDRTDHARRDTDLVAAQLARLPRAAVAAARQVLEGIQRHRKAVGKRRLAARELAAYVREIHAADRTARPWIAMADLYAPGAMVGTLKKGSPPRDGGGGGRQHVLPTRGGVTARRIVRPLSSSGTAAPVEGCAGPAPEVTAGDNTRPPLAALGPR